jgi:hypothetical protein
LTKHVVRALVVSLLASLVVPLGATGATAAAPSGLTTLLSPGEGETAGGNPTFSWTPVPGATKYRVQVSQSSLFDTTVSGASLDTYNTHFTPVTALPTGVLYWRVAPTDGGSGVGSYTSGSFTRVWADAPVVTSPADGATLTYPDDPLLFTWDPLSGAQKYRIEIDDEINFINPTFGTTTNTSYTLTDPQTNEQTFYWRVQGQSGSVVSPWSEPRSYHVEWPEKPVLTSPAVGATVTDVVLQWSPVAGAASYQLQARPNPDFTNNITLNVDVVKGTRYSPPTTLANGSYFWRVRARDTKSSPNLGAWSSDIGGLPAQFTRAWNDRPTLLTPADEDMYVTVPTFSWTPVPHASHYELWIGTDSNFSPGTYLNCYTNQTSFTPYGLFQSSNPAGLGSCFDQEYPVLDNVIYWKVRGIDAPSGVLGLFSDRFSFMQRHVDVPAYVSPADDAVVTVPTLEWEAVLGVARYQVTIQKNGVNVSTPVVTYATTYTPGNLVSGETYTWFVQTIDDQDRLGAAWVQEARWSFTYQAPTELVALPVALTPDAGASLPIMPSMSWTPVTDAKSYQVWYRVQGTDLEYQLGVTGVPAFTFTGMPPTPDTYQWRVKALDSHGEVIGSTPLRTWTIESLPLVGGLSPAKCTPEVICELNGETPRLSWTPTPYTSGYIVYLANDASFTTIVRQYKTQYPTFTPRESLLDSVAGSAYYWFVRPCRDADSGGGCGAYDNDAFPSAGAFRKRSLPIQPLSPADGATVSSVTFSWQEFSATNAANVPTYRQGAKRYRIQVSTVQDFASILDQQEVDQTTYTPYAKTYPEGPLHWRVAAIDGSNNELTYSVRRTLTKASASIVPVYPLSGAELNVTPYFQWEAQPHAKSYEVELYKNGDVNFSAGNKVTTTVFGGGVTRLPAYAPQSAVPTGTYAWRVRRVDADNLAGPWSTGGVFTLASTPTTLLAPAEGTVFTSRSMLFTWTPVTGAAQYTFEASQSPGFTPTIDSATTVMTAWAPTTVNYPDGTVYWRVKVKDGSGNVIAVSDTRTIVKDATVPKVIAKTPTAGAPISGGAYTVTFSENVVGVSSSTFTMKLAASGSPVPGTVTPGVATETTTATFTPTVPLVPGELYTLALSDGISDVNGNALVPFSWSLRTALKVDAVTPLVQLYWDRDTSTSASGGGYLASRTAGARVSYTFTGTSASILGRKAADGGYAEVWLDGVKQSTVSFYAAGTYWKRVIWSKTGLANTTHKVELRVLGTKPSSATSSWVYPDAFRYGASQLEETSSLVVQSHRTVAKSTATGGSYQLATHTASGDTGSQPYVVLKFKGTGVSWSGFRSTSGGIAKVYVDGVAKATVDTYGAASTSPQTLWSTSGLANAAHTLKIVLTGTKRSGSAGYNVAFDAFTVV